MKKKLEAEPTSRELGETIAYALTAYRKGTVEVEKIFTVVPTDANGWAATYIAKALAYHRPASAAVEAVNAIPARCWWHPNEHPVFNNMNGNDLILRKDVLAALAAAGAA